MKPFGNSRAVCGALIPADGSLVPEALLGSEVTCPKAPVAVDANAAEPATFANVRLDILLLIKCSPRFQF
jgi:hypothetical protein